MCTIVKCVTGPWGINTWKDSRVVLAMSSIIVFRSSGDISNSSSSILAKASATTSVEGGSAMTWYGMLHPLTTGQ